MASSKDGIVWEKRKKCWRPTVSDVERISWGKPAKKKGTGSRGVPHRLNSDERLLFDQARRKGFLEIEGSGWRSQRRDSPAINSYRSLCDARGQVCIVLHKSQSGMDDEIVIDLSPLRLPDTFTTIENDLVHLISIPTHYIASEEEMDLSDYDNIVDVKEEDEEEDQWNNRPIYQLPTYCISWKIQRSEAKKLCKRLGKMFSTVEENASKSKKPNAVKAGKARRSGGYGIG